MKLKLLLVIVCLMLVGCSATLQYGKKYYLPDGTKEIRFIEECENYLDFNSGNRERICWRNK